MKLRKVAGRIKYKIYDCYPYLLLQRRAEKLASSIGNIVRSLPPLVMHHPSSFEIHMICGRRQAEMGILASWSLMRFLPTAWLFVHSDGTLTRNEFDAWRSIIANTTYLSRETQDEAVKAMVAGRYPAIYEWWRLYPFQIQAQLIEYHLFGKKDRLISLDSDVLCFSNPVALKEALVTETPFFTWNADTRSCYSAGLDTLKAVTGIRVPAAMNSGLSVLPRLNRDDFEFLDRVIRNLKEDGRINFLHYWSLQTYYAFLASRHRNSKPLPRGYAVMRGKTKSTTVARHYVGIPSIRPRYFTEGVPRILRENLEPGRSIASASANMNVPE